MKKIPLAHAAAALAVLSSLFAATPGEARLFCWGADCVARDKVKERAAVEFKALRDKVEIEQKDDPLKKLYLSQIDATHKRFDSQANAVLKRERYNTWEFDYIGDKVTMVIIPTIKKAVAASAAMPLAERPRAFSTTMAQGNTLSVNFDHDWAAVNEERILASNIDPKAASRPSADKDGEEHRWGTTTEANGDEVKAGRRRGRPFGPPQTAEQLLAQSDVVKLAEASANYALHPTDPVEPPGGGNGGSGNGGSGNGGSGNGAGPRPGGSHPNGSGSGSSGGSVIDAISSPEGVSQLFANNGLQALEDRNYAEALAMSQQALAIDASNRSAMEIFQSVKIGRAHV